MQRYFKIIILFSALVHGTIPFVILEGKCPVVKNVATPSVIRKEVENNTFILALHYPLAPFDLGTWLTFGSFGCPTVHTTAKTRRIWDWMWFLFSKIDNENFQKLYIDQNFVINIRNEYTTQFYRNGVEAEVSCQNDSSYLNRLAKKTANYHPINIISFKPKMWLIFYICYQRPSYYIPEIFVLISDSILDHTKVDMLDEIKDRIREKNVSIKYLVQRAFNECAELLNNCRVLYDLNNNNENGSRSGYQNIKSKDIDYIVKNPKHEKSKKEENLFHIILACFFVPLVGISMIALTWYKVKKNCKNMNLVAPD